MNSPKLLTVFIWSYLLLGIVSLLALPFSWPAAFCIFLFFAFGNGTVAHRYFSHNSFKVSKIMHWILAMWATLTGYTPISYWIAQHRQHHRVADTAADIHSPVNGIAKSFIFWTLDASAIKSIFFERASVVSVARALKDPAINFFNRSFLLTNLIFLIILTAIDYQLLFAAAAAYALEQFRIGSINTCLHLARFPGNYTNHSLSNNSQNNYVLGIITFGFGWHNNHHADAKKLILSEKWWEIDLEGYLGWVLSKTAKQ